MLSWLRFNSDKTDVVVGETIRRNRNGNIYTLVEAVHLPFTDPVPFLELQGQMLLDDLTNSSTQKVFFPPP